MKQNRTLVIGALALLLVGANTPDADSAFVAAMLDTHNAERQVMGTAALKWSDKLARDAQAWADTMARNDHFEHAPQSAQGENLWMGTRSRYSHAEMVEAWIDEKSMFKRGRFPHVTQTEDWRDVGHYTQLIWDNTTHVGCAIASNAEDDYLVCRYGPPGNWEGQDPISPDA
jgi:hypothetical protein